MSETFFKQWNSVGEILDNGAQVVVGELLTNGDQEIAGELPANETRCHRRRWSFSEASGK